MVYRVMSAQAPVSIDGRWDKPAWSAAETLRLSHFMGARPDHFPLVEGKLLHDEKSLYVVFRVQDRYVRAVAAAHQAAIYRDSCVEFFFTPGEDVRAGYFNLELNCGGTMLFHYQVVPRENPVPVSAEDLGRIEVAHSLPRMVDPEIAEPVTWVVEYRLPLDLLGRYAPSFRPPGPRARWRANLYKCADGTSHPHWLTWAPVGCPRPDFHQPMSFGTLEFH